MKIFPFSIRIEQESFHFLKLSEMDDENFSAFIASRARVVSFVSAPGGAVTLLPFPDFYRELPGLMYLDDGKFFPFIAQ